METVKQIDGIQLAARFAMQPNMWGFCGDKNDQSILRQCVISNRFDYQKVRVTLGGHGFPHLNAFLEAIGKATDNDSYSGEVVKAYWYGGKLTEESIENGRKLLIEQYKQRMGNEFGEAVDKILPPEIPLTHLTQVAMIAAADYEEKQRSEVINLCMIARAKLKSINNEDKTAVVTREIVVRQKDGYGVDTKESRLKIDTELTPELRIGSNVAVHLGFVAAKLTESEASNLSFWTEVVTRKI